MKFEWRNKKFSYFQNNECEGFPCHETDQPEEFNCIFCYCPLYALGEDCGGHFAYTDSGIKDCSGCMIPHKKTSYGYIMDHLPKVSNLAAKKGTL